MVFKWTLKETGFDDALWTGEHFRQLYGVTGHTDAEVGVGKLQYDNHVLVLGLHGYIE